MYCRVLHCTVLYCTVLYLVGRMYCRVPHPSSRYTEAYLDRFYKQ